MTDLIGKTLLNRYRVIESLGRGGNAEVYKVWDAHRSTLLAMKVLHADLALDRVFLRRFKREARTLARLQHPNIVRFYDLEQDGRVVFILMDYVEGESLKHRIFDADGPMPLAQVIEIVRPLCQALQYAHKEGFVHSDVKPGNVLMKRSGEVMLTDFGIARMTEAATVTMLGAGTPAYMSPEQARGENPTPHSDIYALGVILFEMLTGERPFTGENAKTGSTSEKVRWEQMKLPAPSPRKFNPALSRELESMVLKCLEKDPARRYVSALELLNALEKAMPATAGERQPRVEPIPAAPPVIQEAAVVQKKKTVKTNQAPQLVWLVSGMVVFVGVILLGIFLLAEGVIKFALPAPTSTSVPPTNTPAPTSTSRPTSTKIPPTPIPSVTQISPKDGMVMVYIPEGEFLMGSEEGYDDESPEHSVYLDAFWIDQTGVTNEMYAKCVADNGACTQPRGTDHFENPSYANHPVVNVNWDMARTYCEWAERRLPSEAEWEKAARGTEGRTYPWGEGISCGEANYVSSCVGDTTPVGSYESGKSPYGVYDMAGNVMEWVNDWYGETYYQSSPSLNPLGPNSGEYRVLRGGSWYANYNYTRSAYRYWSVPSITYNFLGFRCSRDTSP
jgi:formylglycine-generating enzyme required for sulfatase activity/tRNA A-37 threonylcarbamoyl transferase component Bud32